MPKVTIAEVMEAYAREAEVEAHKRGIILDYSEDSLANVDRILETVTNGGLLTPKSTEEKDALWLVSKIYGGYVGQVVIKQLGGKWELQDLPEGGSQIVLRSCEVKCFPADKIYERLAQDRNSGVGGYCRAIRAIVENREKKKAE